MTGLRQRLALAVALPLALGAGLGGLLGSRLVETAPAVMACLLAALACAWLAARWLSRSMTQPLDELARVAESLAQGDYTARARGLRPDELGRLGALLNRLSDKVQADRARMSRLEEVRREFVANVSHELRTPLTSIRGFAETLREGAVDDPLHRMEFLEAIEKDAVRLTALVDDLLELSAIESGRQKLTREPLSLIDAAHEAVGRLHGLAGRHGVTIRVYDAPGLPRVSADPVQIAQVLRNLLENAVKFNREGGSVVVRAEVAGKAVVLVVTDTGMGIPDMDLPRVFERFHRVDKARSREVGGTGLGLAIVKHIVESHGGSVEVSSRLGEGSVFRVKLPL